MTPRLVHASAMATAVALLTIAGVFGLLSDLARSTRQGDAHWWLLRGYVGALVIGLAVVTVGMIAFHRFRPRAVLSGAAPLDLGPTLFAAVLVGNSLIIMLGDALSASARTSVDLFVHAFAVLMALSIRLVWKKEQRIMAQLSGNEPRNRGPHERSLSPSTTTSPPASDNRSGHRVLNHGNMPRSGCQGVVRTRPRGILRTSAPRSVEKRCLASRRLSALYPFLIGIHVARP